MSKLILKKYLDEIEYLINSLNLNDILSLKDKIVHTKKLKVEFLYLEMVGALLQQIILLWI